MKAQCLVFALLMLAVAGCPPPPVTPDHPVPDAEADPTTPPPGVDPDQYSSTDTAGQACIVLEYLKCPEATATCASDVRKLIELGTFQQADVTCIRSSRTIARVQSCNVDCK